jgi:hypothetical protein
MNPPICRLLPGIIVLTVTVAIARSSSASTAFLLPIADTTMTDSQPGTNFGSSLQLPVGVSAPGDVHYHALFKFDLSIIPTNATITNVTLNLIVVQNVQPPALFDLSPLLTNWVEGEVTWINRTASAPWTTPGGLAGTDYTSGPYAIAALNGAGTTNAFTGGGLVYIVQSWLNNPASNFGWILIAHDEQAGSGRQVGSREYFGNEPTLIVDYTAPMTPVVLTPFPITNGVFQYSFHIEPNHGYAMQFKDHLTDTNWTTYLVFDPPPIPQDVVIPNPITTTNRFFRVIAY